MARLSFWLPLLAALTLAGCSTLPTPTDNPSEPNAGADSPYTLRTPGGRGNALIPKGPLQSLSESSIGLQQSNVALLEPPKDLWDRIRRGFAMPDLEDEIVRDREQWYTARPEYMERMTERGSKYLFHIVEELERRNMPLELALLPYIESAFNPQAVSSAKAAGMWQFMPATGRDFDLKQNMFRDDRRDVLASTRAAMDYLERLYKQFDDWHLALAAYNWGEGNVAKAIKRNQAAGLGTSYSELRMPNETRYYVPKLQAVKNIVTDPRRFRTRLPEIGNHPFFDTVALQRDMDVSVIARLADVSEKDFRQLNPSANKPVILASGTPQVLLPWDNAALFEARLKKHAGPLSNWTAWTVPKDMTVAQAAQQHDLSEADLREMNNIPPRMLVKAGSTLMVPRNGQHQADVPEHVADNAQLKLAQEIQLKRVQVKARKGDTVQGLAKRHSVSASNVAEWNQLALNTVLKAGQQVVLFLPQRAGTIRSTDTASGTRKGVVRKTRKKAR
jgi:membrane-bound lytic murein transglycosylase D